MIQCFHFHIRFVSDARNDIDGKHRTEKIISVDEDESEHSDIGDISDSDDHVTHRLQSRDTEGSNSNRDSTNADNGSRNTESKGDNGSQDSHTPVSEGDSQPRPKIWSITNFLGSSKDGCSSQSSKSPDTPAIVCSRQTNKLPYLNYSQSSDGLRVPNGHAQFAVGLQGIPFSLNQTTLSYPYTLSSATTNKTEAHMQNQATLRATEQAIKEEILKKAVRMQNGLFSPARQLDDIRVGKKMVL